MELEQRLNAFVGLGKKLEQYLNLVQSNDELPEGENGMLSEAIRKAYMTNNWFTIDNQVLALRGICHMLNEHKLRDWAASYAWLNSASPSATVAVIMAGNVPAVGFHDFLCVLVSGHTFLGKYSSDDPHLLPALAKLLCKEEPDFEQYIKFTDSQLKSFDAIIATGSNNTARYFDFYFGKYPHIIRGNRNSLGIVNGHENEHDLRQLGTDIFSYFGLGCRNVSHLLLPLGFDLEKLFTGFEPYRHLRDHHKYFNNYEYYKAISIINRTLHHDNGFVLLMPDERLSSPVGVLHYSFYDGPATLASLIMANQSKIQCVVSKEGWYPGSIPFGEAQFPTVYDYPDGVDTMKFLAGLSSEIKK